MSSHAVYSYGIILRVALKFNKKAYLISLDRIKKLNKKFPYEIHYKDFDIIRLYKLNLKKKEKKYFYRGDIF